MKKAVVLAAGEGTRLRPITHAVPKEIVRVGKKPTIEHVLEVLKHGGVEDVLIVVGRKKHAIIDYLGSGKRLDLNIYYRIQEEPKGTAHAVSLAENFVNERENFAIMYGDNYISHYSAMKKIVNFHEEKDGNGTLILHPVDDPRRFGVVKLNDENKVLGMIEKPTLEEAQPYKRDDHWLNIAGLMIVNQKLFDHLEQIEPSKEDELWLTDAVENMRKDRNELYGYVFDGKRYDIGTFESLAKVDRQAQGGNILLTRIESRRFKIKILISGGAGFIGSHTCESLLEKGHELVYVDNLDSYYDVRLKKRNMDILSNYDSFEFVEGKIKNKETVDDLVENVDAVNHQAAQAGV